MYYTYLYSLSRHVALPSAWPLIHDSNSKLSGVAFNTAPKAPPAAVMRIIGPAWISAFSIHCSCLRFLVLLSRRNEANTPASRSEEHKYELQSQMSISYAVYCLN